MLDADGREQRPRGPRCVATEARDELADSKVSCEAANGGSQRLRGCRCAGSQEFAYRLG